MWADAWAEVCGRYPDLVAIFESRQGRLALLLRHSFVPLPHERAAWMMETRRTVRIVTRALRAAGARDAIIVLQWRPAPEVARILGRWACRYDADPARRAELADIVETRVSDGAATARPFRAVDVSAAVPGAAPATLGAPTGDDVGRDRGPVHRELIAWYRNMAPTWLGAEPIVRRQLILRTHRWIVERLFVATGIADDAVRDLAPDGALSRALVATVPHDELARWRPWIRLVVADLRRALAWPGDARSDGWARWLFLIPYAIPVQSRTGAAVGLAVTRTS